MNIYSGIILSDLLSMRYSSYNLSFGGLIWCANIERDSRESSVIAGDVKVVKYPRRLYMYEIYAGFSIINIIIYVGMYFEFIVTLSVQILYSCFSIS